jgi:hypothetical protein
VSVVIVALLAATGGIARADNGPGSAGVWGNVNCDQNPYPGCSLGTGSDSTQTGTGSSGRQPSSSGNGDQPSPDPFYCLDNLLPYSPADGTLPPPDGQSASSGAWYASVCRGVNAHNPTGGDYYPPVWIVDGANPPARITPAELAQSAYSNLHLTAPTIVLSPAGQQLVNLPTWLSITGWAGATATAGLPATVTTPAVSVTATATPTSVVWSTGDGATVTCDGPGTAYTAGDDPASASPTCGHTYRTSSAGQPGAAFAVSATVHWSVAWAGAGQGGVFPDLTTTAAAQVPVAESQALTTH